MPNRPNPRDEPDPRAVYALRVWQFKQGELVSLMIHLGDRLGLYRAMAGAGRLSSEDLAQRTGVHPRWVLEWLRSQAAAGLLESPDGDSFELTSEGAAVLADEESSLWFAAGAFSGAAATPEVVEKLADAFRTGIGLSYDDLGPSAAHQVERMLGPWSRLALVPTILPAIEGLTDRLRRGALVADVGCGAGVALETMAAAFPASRFRGYDISFHAIERARARAAESGADNLEFHVADAAAIPRSEPFDLILTFDCIHDMPRPEEAITSIRAAIADDGVWLIKDIRSTPGWSHNLKNPLLAMMYSTSVATCMSSAMSEPGGAGLGTLGFNPSVAERMCTEGGFRTFVVHDFDDPANLYYEVRP
jgi:2-polyprenyl-3-methyl-5-hydroxy-6-metoxy-1,4-benzoquinol methylase